MNIDAQDIDNLRRMIITGRLDIAGTDASAIKCAARAASAQRHVGGAIFPRSPLSPPSAYASC